MISQPLTSLGTLRKLFAIFPEILPTIKIRRPQCLFIGCLYGFKTNVALLLQWQVICPVKQVISSFVLCNLPAQYAMKNMRDRNDLLARASACSAQ
jgi:hypothetical protein